MSELPAIVVIGSLNMDLVVQASKFPEEGETIIGESFFSGMGGKGANQAIAAARLGAKVTLIGAVGDDDYGEKLLKHLKNEGIHTSYIVKVQDAPTGIACVHLGQSDNRITVIPGANYKLQPAHIDKAEHIIEAADIVLFQMEIPVDTVIYGIDMAKRLGKTVILNPAPAFELPKDLLSKVDYLIPNELELHTIASSCSNAMETIHSAQHLLNLGVKHIIVTLGEKGAAYYSVENGHKHFQAYPVNVVDTTGAGDAFNGAIAYSLASGDELYKAIAYAMKVGAYAVTKLGAQGGMPSSEELETFL